jgi:DNA-binding GntR family transcriptional regulator
MILEKKIPPGDKINQNSMAATMRISRTPVVNALHKLESEGLVDNVPHTGFFVHQITVKEVLDLFALRQALEAIVVTELVETITQPQIQQLEGFFTPFVARADDIDTERYRKADVKFHTTMLDMCDNKLAKRVNENFQILPRSFMAGLLRPPAETLSEHMTIVEALASRDLQRARDAVAAHNNGTRALLQDMVLNLRRIGADPERITVEEFHRSGR